MNALLGQLAAHPVVVLEGCDGAGKTTIAQHLEHHFGYTIVHSPPTPADVDLVTRYTSLVTAPGRIVLDRSFVSELVYGPILRGRSRISLEQAQHLARRVRERNGTLVHLTAPPTVLHNRLLERGGETVPTLQELQHIIDAYTELLAQLSGHVQVIPFDTTIDPPG